MKARADDIARLADQSEEEADFLVDRLRSGLLFQPRGLVGGHGLFRYVNDHQRPEVSDDIAHRVLGEDNALVPHSIIPKISPPKLPNGFDPFFAFVLDSIEPPFQFPASIPLRLLRHGLRFGICGFAHAPPGKEKLVPPGVASFEEPHSLLCRLRW